MILFHASKPKSREEIEMAVIDLKSDTVTRPGEEMRKAMYQAEVGDDVYGEDPTVNALEEKAAEMTGKEDALFVASGTMGNLVSLLTHCKAGDGAILGNKSHIYYYEAGGLSALGGILPLIVDDSEGLPFMEEVSHWMRPENVHFVPASLLCLENTHNKCGGIAIPPDRFGKTADQAREWGMYTHLDGARIFNAAIACGVNVMEYTKKVDSVQICLSKGLGAPVGSMICADRDFIARARHWRKRVGGGMRQAGIIAAAGLYALENNVSRLQEDHDNCRILSDLLTEGGLDVENNGIGTNMVFFRVELGENGDDELLQRCADRNVQFNKVEPGRFRLVTHINVSADQVREAAGVILEEVEACR